VGVDLGLAHVAVRSDASEDPGFGERPGETDREQSRHRAPGRLIRNAGDRPVSKKTVPLVDEVSIDQAAYDADAKTLTVSASSSDRAFRPPTFFTSSPGRQGHDDEGDESCRSCGDRYAPAGRADWCPEASHEATNTSGNNHASACAASEP
jgi:hypothetical protein